MAEMELDRWTIVRPFEPVQPTLRPLQALLHLAGVGHAEHRGGPPGELDDVFPNHVREDVHFRFGRIPEARADVLLGPGMFRSGVGIPRVVLGPVSAVDADVSGFRIPHGSYFRVRSHWTMSLI